MKITGASTFYSDGAEISFTCSVGSANPPPDSFTWTKNGEENLDITTATYTETVSSADDDGAQYTCAATNTAGGSFPSSVQIIFVVCELELGNKLGAGIFGCSVVIGDQLSRYFSTQIHGVLVLWFCTFLGTFLDL